MPEIPDRIFRNPERRAFISYSNSALISLTFKGKDH